MVVLIEQGLAATVFLFFLAVLGIVVFVVRYSNLRLLEKISELQNEVKRIEHSLKNIEHEHEEIKKNFFHRIQSIEKEFFAYIEGTHKHKGKVKIRARH